MKSSSGAITAILATLMLAILSVAFLMVGDRITRDKMEAREASLIRIVDTAKLETARERIAAAGALMASKDTYGLAAAWSLQMSNLEAEKRYAKRDSLFFQALGYLDAYQMYTFLKVNREYFMGYDDETLIRAQTRGTKLPPVIDIARHKRKALNECYKFLKSQTQDMFTGSLEEEPITLRVTTRLKILMPSLFFKPCDLNPSYF